MERLQERGTGPHLEAAVVDGGNTADVQGLQRCQLRKLEAVGVAEVDLYRGLEASVIADVIADVQFLQM